MNSLYNHLREASSGVYEYSKSVPVSMYMPKPTSEYSEIVAPDVVIPFNLDIDYSSSGISSIDFLVTATIRIPYTILKYAKDSDIPIEENRSIDLDLSTTDIDWVSGSQYSIDELVVSSSDDGGVIASRLLCTYIDKSK